jgi:hypothetical protein
MVLAQPLQAQDQQGLDSIDLNFLTYEDSVNGFKIQYPSDWKKVDYRPAIPMVVFASVAENSTDNFFENVMVTVERLPAENITLDQYTHSLIEQSGLSYPEFDVISPPEDAMLGGVPAHNMTFTSNPSDNRYPTITGKVATTQIWAVKDSNAYNILYTKAEGQVNHNIDNAAKKMIRSVDFLPSQQITISKIPQTELDNATRINQTGNNFLTYFNSTYGVQIEYPQNWNANEYPTFDYGIAYIFPNSENETTLDLRVERLPYQEIALDDYLESRLEYLNPLNLSESNTNTTTLAGRPAYRLVYYEVPFSIDSRKVMEVGTIINGRVYQASYSTSPDRFLQNLPVIQRMLDTLQIVPTNNPPAPPSVNNVEFLTYENSTFGINIQYPSNWISTNEVGLGNISFVLPKDIQPGLFDFMRSKEQLPEYEDVFFVEIIPLTYAVSESAFLDEFIPMWLSSMKDSLTDFNLTESGATTLDDSPAQILEYSYAYEVLPSIKQKALSIFAVEDNILYRIGYQPWSTTSYYDNIPVIRKMIESFEILEEKGFRHVEEF